LEFSVFYKGEEYRFVQLHMKVSGQGQCPEAMWSRKCSTEPRV